MNCGVKRVDSQSIHEHLESVRGVIVAAALMPSFVSAGYRRFLGGTQTLRVLPYLSSSKGDMWEAGPKLHGQVRILLSTVFSFPPYADGLRAY